MVMLTEKQAERVKKWEKLTGLIPQWENPRWLVQFLAEKLPDRCIFHTEITWRSHLIIYIPTLCGLNPWFNAIIAQKLVNWGQENGFYD